MRLFKLHRPERVDHLLVIRLTDLGQTAMTVHALRAVRAAYPELRITVLTDARFVPLFRKIENIDFLPLAPHDRFYGIVGFFRLKRALRRLDAQAVVDLEGSRRSRRLYASLRPWRRRRAVIDNGKVEKELMTRKFRKVLVQLKSTVERSVDAFARVGFDVAMPAPVRRAPHNRKSALLTILAGEKEGTWVGIAPFSKHRGKCYTIPQTDRLVELLLKSCSRVFIIGEGKYERQFGEGMELRHRRGVVSLVDRADITDELDALKVLDVVVTVDNPVLRLASLVGTPVVSVWGATHRYIDSCGYGQNPQYAVELDLSCRPCSVSGNAPCLFGHYECMRLLTPELVAATVEKLTAKSNKH